MTKQKDRAFLDAYGKPEITLLDGKVVQAKPLLLARSTEWLRIGAKAEAGDPDAEAQILAKFFDEIDIAEHVKAYLPLEAMVIFWRFFTVNRFRRNGGPQTVPEETQPSTTSDSR